MGKGGGGGRRLVRGEEREGRGRGKEVCRGREIK